MPGPPLRVALLGGVPPSLGGGGLEIQLRRTADALARRGNRTVFVAAEPDPQPFDVLHAFASGPDVAHALAHWRRRIEVPLVVSPVMVVPPGQRTARQWVAHRLPIPEFGPWQRRAILQRADRVVALTDAEHDLLRRLIGRGVEPVDVVPNGVDPIDEPEVAPDGLPDPYVALVGTVNARKRQLETVRALTATGGPAPVVAGGFEGSAADRAAFEAAVENAGGVWLGEVTDPRVVRHVVRAAAALIHLSSAEGQSLAVLESLAEGTPVAVSPLAANRELAARFPAHVALVEHDGQLEAALARLASATGPAPVIPTWDDVAARLERVYHHAGARPATA